MLAQLLFAVYFAHCRTYRYPIRFGAGISPAFKTTSHSPYRSHFSPLRSRISCHDAFQPANRHICISLPARNRYPRCDGLETYLASLGSFLRVLDFASCVCFPSLRQGLHARMRHGSFLLWVARGWAVRARSTSITPTHPWFIHMDARFLWFLVFSFYCFLLGHSLKN